MREFIEGIDQADPGRSQVPIPMDLHVRKVERIGAEDQR